MNKKFSTLVAGVLLATSVGTVNATPSYAKYVAPTTPTYAQTIKAGTYYQLMTSTAGEVVAMVPVTGGTYKLQTVTTADAVDARYTLWTIDVQGNATDGYRYAFINLGTRSVLAVDPATALKAINNGASATTVGGDVALWKWQDAYNPVAGFASGDDKELTSVFGAKNDSIVTWVKGTNHVYALKYALNNPVTVTGQLKVVPVDPQAIVLGVDDLNSMLWANTEAGKLKLTFDEDVKGGNPAAINLFTKQEFKAVAPVGFPANYGYIDPTNKGWKVGLVATTATGNDLDITTYSQNFLDYVDKSQTESLLKAIKKALGTGSDYTNNQVAYEQAISALNEFHLYNSSTPKVETRADLLKELDAFQSAIANFDVNEPVYKALKKAFYEFVCNTIDTHGGWGVSNI